MSDRRSGELGLNLDRALSSFPFPERDWEADARRVEARLGERSHHSTEPSLLAAPSPAEPDEPNIFSATTTPLTHSGVRAQTLTEMARRSVEKKQAADREMARATLAIAARARPIHTERTPQAQGSNTASARRDPPSTSSVVASAAAVPAAAPTVARPAVARKLAIGLSALAVAALALLWFGRTQTPAPLAMGAPQPPAAIPVAAPTPVAAVPTANTASPSAVSALNNPTAANPQVPIDPQALPTEAPAKIATLKSAASPAGASASAEKNAPAGRHATATAARAGADSSTDKSLPLDPEMRPADSTGGALPAKPSTGAVQAALGSVLSGARRCVAGDDAPSSAIVVFGSDGRVEHVTVSGPAAGKPSAACIQAQLGRARVQPFGATNFSVNTTIRPE